jgi:plastocyanin
MAFPDSLDSPTRPNTTDPQNAPSHAGIIDSISDSIEAAQAKIGADASAVITSHDYKLTPRMITLTDGATVTIDLTKRGIHTITLGGNRILAVSGETAGQVFVLRIIQDGSGTRTVTWFSTIKWAGGVAPTLTTTLNKIDVFGFICTGTDEYDGFVIGTNL